MHTNPQHTFPPLESNRRHFVGPCVKQIIQIFFLSTFNGIRNFHLPKSSWTILFTFRYIYLFRQLMRLQNVGIFVFFLCCFIFHFVHVWFRTSCSLFSFHSSYVNNNNNNPKCLAFTFCQWLFLYSSHFIFAKSALTFRTNPNGWSRL